MPNCKTQVPYSGTQEQEQQLRELIVRFKDMPGAAMPLLQRAQELFGYLPEEALVILAQGLNMPLEELYGIASFYAQFTLNPKGRHQISVCLGTACYVKGSADILDAVVEVTGCAARAVTPDGKFSVDATRCIGACGLAPVMMVGEDVYGRLTPDQVEDILNKYN